jgi:VWFA-related protein
LLKQMHLPLIFALLAAVLVQPALAADPVNVEITAFEERAGAITVTVSASGPDGRPLTGLTATNFSASLDGKPLTVREAQVASAARVPASILLMVDVSGSMYGEPMAQAHTAIRQFIQNLDVSDRVAIMAFGSDVRIIQDFTTNRSLLDEAVGRLTPFGDTVLYDAVIVSTQQMARETQGRRMVVLLSDGVATSGVDKRARSLEAARQAQVGFVAVGLGSAIDAQYLNELAQTSGGRYIDAPTPASLSSAYGAIANTIRSQYTLTLIVPPAIDRSLPGTLVVQARVAAGAGQAEQALGPLAGAAAPPFDIKLAGLSAGQRVTAPISLQASAADQRVLAGVEYLINGALAHAAPATNLSFELDPSLIESGSYILTVRATDAAGRVGELQVPFILPVPPLPARPFPVVPVVAVLGVVLAGALSALLIHKRRQRLAEYDMRMNAWSGRGQPPDEWQDRASEPRAAEPERLLGRLFVAPDAASGVAQGARVFAIYSSPLTIGTGPHADVRLEDHEGVIGAEEARIWVQKGTLVYHKLTTLSAMATEGLTPSWQFLDSGEELNLGAYRLLFEAEPEPVVQAAGAAFPAQDRPPLEHGMAFSSWPKIGDESLPSAAE